ncbi:hypothetical protein SS50377_27824 [Spironucleus salmonicida]|uniref:Probable ubiquitin carboxyl-terminal hydrolase MINDY-4 n=1 Tax=Spironucleus salmonicida TaxID=348837 RepID=V6LX83_9EUKA|nr:hypothetical protein SS50377_27824 [Spironucleus salmonicida]|eukprot:EST48858.1 hypothetical protein SS50377_10956 [Spironucleus salmonicida]
MSFSNDDLIIALFKEYLLVNNFRETQKQLQVELPSTAISKRSEMIDALNLRKQALEEKDKKDAGQPYIKSTLELLINGYIQSLSSQRPLKSRPSSAKKTTKKAISIDPETLFATTNSASIWSQPSKQQTLKKALPTSASQKHSSFTILSSYISQTSNLNNFFKTLFAEKRVKNISDNWYQSLFKLSEKPQTLENPQTWGLHQSNGGPCGFLAVVQARMLKYQFFGEPYKIKTENNFQSAALSALFDILYIINPKSTNFVLPLSFDEPQIQLDFVVQDMQNFQVCTIQNDNLKLFLSSKSFLNFAFSAQITSFIPCMVVTFILSRGIDNILAQDFDQTGFNSSSLFSNFNNCSQELVNLMLIGRATASLHDGDLDVGGMILKGAHQVSDVGIVTIFEFFDYLKVGKNLKSGVKFPIWVCFNEAHYTVLFCQKWKTRNLESGKLEFVYFDQLDDQKVLYQLSVKYDREGYERNEMDSFVENLLQTLLPVVGVDWNGADKLL